MNTKNTNAKPTNCTLNSNRAFHGSTIVVGHLSYGPGQGGEWKQALTSGRQFGWLRSQSNPAWACTTEATMLPLTPKYLFHDN